MDKFTSAEKKEIEKMFNQGSSVREISRSFKVRISVIFKELHKYKVFQHKDDYYNLDLLYKIRDLNNQGLLKNEICKKLNIRVSQLNLYFHIIKNKCPANGFDRLGLTREDVLRVIVLIEEGRTYAEVSLKLGKKIGTVTKCANCLKSYGIYLKKGKLNYSEGLELPDLELEDECTEYSSTEEKKPITDSKMTNNFMVLKSKGFTDEEVSKELNMDMQVIEQLKEECAKYKVRFKK